MMSIFDSFRPVSCSTELLDITLIVGGAVIVYVVVWSASFYGHLLSPYEVARKRSRKDGARSGSQVLEAEIANHDFSAEVVLRGTVSLRASVHEKSGLTLFLRSSSTVTWRSAASPRRWRRGVGTVEGRKKSTTTETPRGSVTYYS